MQANTEIVLNKLQQMSNQALPGWDAQRLMSPTYRGELDMNKIMDLNPKIGAVAIILYEKNEKLHFVLTQRHEYNGTHSGQISLPGGKKEPDEIPLYTSIRETKEEIGIDIHEDHLYLSLSPIYIPPSHFLVHPFVFYISEINGFFQDEFEVKEIIEIPLSKLLEPTTKIITEVPTSQGILKNIPAYQFQNKIVWGATAIILSELEAILDTRC